MFPRNWCALAMISLGLLGAESNILGQANVWTNPASGYWEEPYWSAGVLPTNNASILFTNYGWKALAIGPSTTREYPQTLHVSSLTISSPSNSFNELLLNYAGLETPLVVGDWHQTGRLSVAPDSAVVMLSSALQVSNAVAMGQDQGAFSVGGTFNQSDRSEVSAGFLNVGDIGPGTYNLTNGIATIGHEHIGGNFPASFNQFGGTNLTGTGLNPLCLPCAGVQLSSGGQYNLYDGYFEGSVSFQNASFTQYGGVASARLGFVNGSYHLAGGTLFAGGLTFPQYPNCPGNCDTSGSFLQTGGTNYAYVVINGVDSDPVTAGGQYVLGGGVLIAGGLSVGPGCAFSQSDGLNFAGGIELDGTYVLHGPKFAYFNFSGGQLSAAGINIKFGFFNQTGGTNQVNGDIVLSGDGYGAGQIYSLGGGQLSESNLSVIASPGGASFGQGGGVHVIHNRLVISGQLTSHFTLGGGSLTVPNIEVASGAVFHHAAGALTTAGTLTLALGTWEEQSSGQQFGPLQLGYRIQNYYSGGTNSTLSFPTSSCVIRFAESRAVPWTNNTALFIEGWNGALSGGGKHQLIFGSGGSGLTATQLSQVLFHNPAGNSGMYPAMVLASGEVVPGYALGIQVIGATIRLNWGGDLLLGTATNVLGPYQFLTNAHSPYVFPVTTPKLFFMGLRPQ